MKPRSFIIFFLVLNSTIQPRAQVNDACLWTSLNIEKKFTPLLSANLNQEFRFNENLSELGAFYTDIGLNYKINKSIRISGNTRFIYNHRLDDSYSKRGRYYFDLSFRQKYKPVIISFRTRFQSQYKLYAEDDEINPIYCNRNKVTLKFDLDKKISPFLFSEIFVPLNKKINNLMIDNIRYAMGIDYKVNRMHSIDLFYMIDKELNQSNPLTNYIIGLSYNFNF